MSSIKWWVLASKIRKHVGIEKYTRLQSWLKYIQRFNGEYRYGGKPTQFKKQTYVFMIDGKTIHGGLSDRLRGAFSVYGYCKKYHKEFKICWDYPFNLQDYLKPSSFDWRTDKNGLSFNLKDVDFKFFNTYTGLDGKTEDYYKLLESNKREIHVYSNVSIEEDRYKEYFYELFVPSSSVEKLLGRCKKEISDSYISVTFRFIGLLGDFKDDVRWLKSDNEMNSDFYINKCLGFIQKLHLEYPQYKILVTADSILFLEEAKMFPYVYVIPGNMVHMDYSDNNTSTTYLKTFVDFMMISHADRCFSYCVGNMFKLSRFAKTAAMIGSKDFEIVIENVTN